MDLQSHQNFEKRIGIIDVLDANRQSNTWHHIKFDVPFADDAKVVIMPMVQTNNGYETPKVRIQNVSRLGFDIRIDEIIDTQNNLSDGHYVPEIVGWIAYGFVPVTADQLPQLGYEPTLAEAAYIPESGEATYAPESGEATYAPESQEATYAPESQEATYAPESQEATYVPASQEAAYAPESQEAAYAPESQEAAYAPESEEATYTSASQEATYAPESGEAAYTSGQAGYYTASTWSEEAAYTSGQAEYYTASTWVAA